MRGLSKAIITHINQERGHNSVYSSMEDIYLCVPCDIYQPMDIQNVAENRV